MNDTSPLATIDCPVCAAWVEIHLRRRQRYAIRGWQPQDEQLCKAPPLPGCPHLHATIARQFPKYLPSTRELHSIPFVAEVFVADHEPGGRITQMPAWIHSRGLQPICFRYVQERHGMLVRVAFTAEAEASAFAETFGGRVLTAGARAQ